MGRDGSSRVTFPPVGLRTRCGSLHERIPHCRLGRERGVPVHRREQLARVSTADAFGGEVDTQSLEGGVPSSIEGLLLLAVYVILGVSFFLV